MKKTLELEQKNELLADKGEIIDGLRAECQERRETERYTKHRIGNNLLSSFSSISVINLQPKFHKVLMIPCSPV